LNCEIDAAAVSSALAKMKVSTGGALPEPPPMGSTMLAKGMVSRQEVAITVGGLAVSAADATKPIVMISAGVAAGRAEGGANV